MEIKTAADIDNAAVSYLRKQSGKSQREFWNSVGISQPGGWKYESSGPIPEPVRQLVFAIYVAGIDLDSSTPEGAERVLLIGKQLRTNQLANPAMAEKLDIALAHLNSASKIINDIT